MAFSFIIQPLGDAALTIFFSKKVDENVNRAIIELSHQFRSMNGEILKDVIPAYSSLTLYYDPEKIWSLCASNETAFEYMFHWVKKELLKDTHSNQIENQLIRVPVCYAEKFAPDLLTLATEKSLNIEEVIRLHTSDRYRVYMIGFLPGFAYMGILNEKIRMPRKKQPVLQIPAGSVGIAGKQTGIYPLESPGGWQIIGRTPLKLFDKDRTYPVLFQPGDQVDFYSITEDEFENY